MEAESHITLNFLKITKVKNYEFNNWLAEDGGKFLKKEKSRTSKKHRV